MMILPPIHVTSAVLWRAVLIVAPIDIVFVSLLASRLRFASLRHLTWLITGTTAVFFAAMGVWLDTCRRCIAD